MCWEYLANHTVFESNTCPNPSPIPYSIWGYVELSSISQEHTEYPGGEEIDVRRTLFKNVDYDALQGSKFAVATVANATTFCHLLPGCSTGSKHLLLP